MAASAPSTRDRVMDAAMQLCGKRFYAATSIADLESAAGLSPGSGSLYRHLTSKEALLAGVRRRVAEGAESRAALQTPSPGRPAELWIKARSVVRAGFDRLEQEKDLNRLVLKDLRQFPETRELVRDEDIGAVHRAVASWLQARANVRSRPGRPRRWPR